MKDYFAILIDKTTSFQYTLLLIFLILLIPTTLWGCYWFEGKNVLPKYEKYGYVLRNDYGQCYINSPQCGWIACRGYKDNSEVLCKISNDIRTSLREKTTNNNSD